MLLSSVRSYPWVFLLGFLGCLVFELSRSSWAGTGLLVVSIISIHLFHLAFCLPLWCPLPLYPRGFIPVLFSCSHSCGAPGRTGDKHLYSKTLFSSISSMFWYGLCLANLSTLGIVFQGRESSLADPSGSWHAGILFFFQRLTWVRSIFFLHGTYAIFHLSDYRDISYFPRSQL